MRGMDRKMRVCPALLAAALLAGPAVASAEPSWSCSATAGWASGRAPAVGGNPCPVAQATAGSAAGFDAAGTIRVDGGGESQTTDARRPRAAVDLETLTIANADGSFTLDASKLASRADAFCDSNRRPAFASAGSPGTVSLNGRPIDTSRDYSEPGLGVNGAPLFGKITIRFGEVAKSDTGLTRREIHVVVTDKDGAVVFEAVAGEVGTQREGAVCEPPPICPAGQEPQAGRCVQVTVAPLPPPSPVPGTSIPGQPQRSPAKPRARGCRDSDARAKRVPAKRVAAAALCLMNAERQRRDLARLRSNGALRAAADAYARAMVSGRFFSHGDLLDRILRSGYIGRFGRWRLGENLGWGWGNGASPGALMRSWMRSSSHRRNILSRRFRDVGVAAAFGSPGRRKPGSITYVVDFGASG